MLAWSLGASSLIPAASSWTQEDIQLANQYLEWLIEKPDDEAMVHLLWSLYQKHGATEHLLKSLAEQSRQQDVVEAPLVYTQLLIKAKRAEEAWTLLKSTHERFGPSSPVLKGLVQVSEILGRSEAQVTYLEAYLGQVNEASSEQVDAQLKLAELQERLGNRDAAARWWKQVAAQPKLTQAQYQPVLQHYLAAQNFEQVLELYERWVAQSREAEQWPLYLEMSQIAQLKGDEALAERYLLEGKASLLPSHPSYDRYWVRWYKSYERRGSLAALEKKLLEQAEHETSELKRQFVWWDLYRFYSLKDDDAKRYEWIEKLAKAVPHEASYTALWLRLSLEQGKSDLVLGYLSEDFKTLLNRHAPFVFMKAEAYLLSNQAETCETWLSTGASLPELSPALHEQLRAFAKQQGFFAVYESMLQNKYRQIPGDKATFLELARHYQGQNRKEALEAWVNQYLHEKPAERATRLSVISEFYGASSQAVDLEKLTRETVDSPEAGREEWLRWVDLLISDGKTEEALVWLERALTKSESLEQVLEIDERIYSVLAGGNSPVDFSQKPTKAMELSNLFTGEGFGEEAKPNDVVEFVPEEIQVYALERVHPFLETREAFQEAMDQLSEIPYRQLQRELPYVSKTHPLSYFRALWWTTRSKLVDLSQVLQANAEYGVLQAQPEFSIQLAKLELEIAIEQEAVETTLLKLDELKRLDPGHGLNYDLRWIDVHLRQGGQNHRTLAIERLEALTRDQFLDEQVLGLLSQLYFESGRREEAMALWKDAIEASQYQNQALLEHFSEILLAQGDSVRYWELLMNTLQREPSVEKREEALRRGLDRVSGRFPTPDQSLSPEMVSWLDQLKPQVALVKLRQPLDSFWHLAAAELEIRYRSLPQAFEFLKRAYEVQPENLELLKRLKSVALQLGKVQDALQYQQQYAQGYQGGQSLTEWEDYLSLLEENLELMRADEVRAKVEQRFAQNQTSLESFAAHYLQTGQLYRAREVLGKLQRFAERDPELMWRLSLSYEKVAATADAMHYAERWLAQTQREEDVPLGVAFWSRDASPQGMVPNWLMENLPRMTEFSESERQAILEHWRQPRDFLAAEPVELRSKRLQMLQRWSRLNATLHTPRVLSSQLLRGEDEATWLAFFTREETALKAGLETWLSQLPFRLDSKSVGPWLDWMWLALESGQGAWMLEAIAQDNRPQSSRATLKRWFKGVLFLHAQDAGSAWPDTFWDSLEKYGEFAYHDWSQLMRQFEFRRDYANALKASEVFIKVVPERPIELMSHHAKLLADVGDHAAEKEALDQALRLPQATGLTNWSSFDFTLWAARRYLLLESNHQEQQNMLARLRQNLLRTNQVVDAPLRFSRVDGMAGSVQKATNDAVTAQLRDGITAHAVAPPLMSRLLPGTHRDHGEAVDPSAQLSGYWSSAYEWQNTWQQDGLLPLLKEVNASMEMALGGVLQGSVTSQEFRRWKIQSLVVSLYGEKSTKRRALVEAFIEKDSSIEMLGELGVILEALGFYRECLPFYQQLPLRAPTNNDYSEQFLRATERAWQSGEAVEYLEKMIAAVAELKPNGISRDLMRDHHAMHLARLHRVEELEALSQQSIALSRRGTVGRIPEPVAYLRALGRLYHRYGETHQSEARWKRLLELVPEDRESILELAQAYETRGEHAALAALLKPVQFTTYWDEKMRDIFVIKVRHHARKKEWIQVERLLKVLGVTHAAPQSMWSFQATPEASEVLLAQTYVAVAEILSEAGHRSMAQSLLLARLRACKFDEARACYVAKILPELDLPMQETVAQEMLLLLQRMPLSVWDSSASLHSLASAMESHPHVTEWQSRLQAWTEAPKAQGLLFLDLWLQRDAASLSVETLRDWQRFCAGEGSSSLKLLEALMEGKATSLVSNLLERTAFSRESLELRFELAASQRDVDSWNLLKQQHGVWLQAQPLAKRLRWWSFLGRQEVVVELVEARLLEMKRHGERDVAFVALAVETFLEVGQAGRAETVLVEHSGDLSEDLPSLVSKVYNSSATEARTPNWEAMDLPDALLQECLLMLEGKLKERTP